MSLRGIGWWVSGVVSGVVLACPLRPVSALEPTQGFPAIQRAFLREDFEAVTSLAQTFITQHPDVPEASRVWFWLALSLDRLQRPYEALNELELLKQRLAADDALWPELFFWEGEISRRALQTARAKAAYQRLLERYPTSSWAPQARVGLGLLYIQQQAFEPAIELFHDVAIRQADTPLALDALRFEGLCQLRRQHFQEAVGIFQSLLTTLSEPDLIAQASFYLGEGCSGLGQYDQAAQAYQRAIAAAADSPWSELAQFGLGWAFYAAGRCEESIPAFAQYLTRAIADHHTEALFAQGSCLLQVGRTQEAFDRFEQILSREPDHALALEAGLLLAEAYRRDGAFAQAKELLHSLLRRHYAPAARAKLQLQLAAVALESGNAVQAKMVYTLAAESADPMIRQAALSGLGDVHVFLGALPAAKQCYHDAVALAPQSAQASYARYQVGRIHLQEGAWREATELFEHLANTAEGPLADDARLALALAWMNQRADDRARALLESLRQRQPGSAVAARAAYYEALLALDDGDEEAAQRLCEEAVAGAPGTDEAFEARLLQAELRLSSQSARQVMAVLVRLDASERLSPSQHARLAKRIGDLARSDDACDEAITWYDRATAWLPSLAGEMAYRTASCYEDGGDVELAMQWYGRVDQRPWSVRGQLAVAKLLERQDRLAEALTVYERLAQEPVPEAKVAQERLAILRGEH